MNRRQAIKVLAAVSAASVILPSTPAAATTTAGKYGPLDVHRWITHRNRTGERLRVYLNGVDVTEHCYFADDVEGIVRVWKTNAQGRRYLDPATHRAASEELHGAVVIKPGPSL